MASSHSQSPVFHDVSYEIARTVPCALAQRISTKERQLAGRPMLRQCGELGIGREEQCGWAVASAAEVTPPAAAALAAAAERTTCQHSAAQ